MTLIVAVYVPEGHFFLKNSKWGFQTLGMTY